MRGEPADAVACLAITVTLDIVVGGDSVISTGSITLFYFQGTSDAVELRDVNSGT